MESRPNKSWIIYQYSLVKGYLPNQVIQSRNYSFKFIQLKNEATQKR